MVFSSKPTVLTQYPRAQKCNPVTRLRSSTVRCIRTALFPFRNPITNATLNLGGICRHICTWSSIKCFSSNSTPLCRHKSRITSPTRFRIFPYNTFFRYFGTMTTWYLQSHLTCDKLAQSCIGSSPLLPFRSFPGGRTYFISPQIGRTSPGPPPEAVGLVNN